MKKQEGNSGVGFLGLLGVLFIGLKLADVIDWSWWIVTMPLWGGFALVAVAFLFFVGLTARS